MVLIGAIFIANLQTDYIRKIKFCPICKNSKSPLLGLFRWAILTHNWAIFTHFFLFNKFIVYIIYNIYLNFIDIAFWARFGTLCNFGSIFFETINQNSIGPIVIIQYWIYCLLIKWATLAHTKSYIFSKQDKENGTILAHPQNVAFFTILVSKMIFFPKKIFENFQIFIRLH